MRFPLIPKLVTLDDLERLIRTLAEKMRFTEQVFVPMTPALSHHKFGVFSLDPITQVGVSPSRIFNSNRCEKNYLNVTDRQTDGRTTTVA